MHRKNEDTPGHMMTRFGKVALAAVFAGILALSTLPASAQEADMDPTAAESAHNKVESLLSGTKADLPWYRSFTLRSNEEVADGAFLPLNKPDVEFRASSQWGVTIGLPEQDPLLETKDRMSAGAFYDISPRIRLGGELSFTAPGELRVSTPTDHALPMGPGEEAPSVRIESSIRF